MPTVYLRWAFVRIECVGGQQAAHCYGAELFYLSKQISLYADTMTSTRQSLTLRVRLMSAIFTLSLLHAL